MKPTLILCGSGSEHPQGRSTMAGLVNAVRREAQDFEVIDAFVERQDPSIDDVVVKTAGPRSIVPLMLAHDRSVSVDIVRASHRDPAVTVTPTLGPDWVIAEVGVRRLVEAGARSDDTIVLAAAATIDPRAVDDVSKAARLLSAVWGGRVHVGSLGGPDAPLADAVDVARAYGRRVVISTYLLGPGNDHELLLSAGADIVTSPLLDGGVPDPRIVSLIAARARARSPRWPDGSDVATGDDSFSTNTALGGV